MFWHSQLAWFKVGITTWPPEISHPACYDLFSVFVQMETNRSCAVGRIYIGILLYLRVSAWFQIIFYVHRFWISYLRYVYQSNIIHSFRELYNIHTYSVMSKIFTQLIEISDFKWKKILNYNYLIEVVRLKKGRKLIFLNSVKKKQFRWQWFADVARPSILCREFVAESV